jgi:hypothetical protein
VFWTVIVQVCYHGTSVNRAQWYCVGVGVSYASICSAREEWVARSGLARIAENTLRNFVAIAVEDEGDLVADCRFDGGGREGEAGFGHLYLDDAVTDEVSNDPRDISCSKVMRTLLKQTGRKREC